MSGFVKFVSSEKDGLWHLIGAVEPCRASLHYYMYGRESDFWAGWLACFAAR